MSILKEFYNGNLTPYDTIASKEYADKQQEIVRFEGIIREKLGKSEETWKLLFDLSLATAGLNAITAEENFIYGFELGARFMVEILGAQT